MLVLTRKPGESIQIGPDVRITILRFTSNGMRIGIGIDAPRDVEIVRTEILERNNDDEVGDK